MNLLIAINGASGAYSARSLVAKSPWPVSLIASGWGRKVYERECGPIKEIEDEADAVFEDDDLEAAVSSGSVPTVGMVITPCSCHTLARIAGGLADTLIARAAHCHLKERRKLILCVRETPWTSIDLENAARLTAAGAVIMPISIPYYMFGQRDVHTVSVAEAMEAYTDRVLAVLGHRPATTWKDVS